MLEMDSDRQVFEPALDQKTDSIYYILGTMKGVQEAIDQYVLVGELRGDLLAPTEFADTALSQLYNYTATTANKYDSAYVYYRVINNCNYYITHRDTTLLTGSRQVAMQEYAEALAIRAWSYMQLAKTYGRVPFYTVPLDNISQGDAITANVADYRDLQGLCDELAPELTKFVNTAVPNYGDINAYRTNWGETKTVPSSRMMFPVALVLGDLYLEAGRFEEAAQIYFNYLRDNRIVSYNRPCGYELRETYDMDFDVELIPSELELNTTRKNYTEYGSYTWTGSFSLNPTVITTGDVITYIPMAVNRLQGTASALPELFGYNLYGFNNENYYLEHALTWSDEYQRLTDAQPFYFLMTLGGNVPMQAPLGDMRRWASARMMQQSVNNVDNETYVFISKFFGANVPIYRGSIIYLRLAECLNRMGYPDAAFAVLKDGLGNIANTIATTRQMVINYELDDEGNPVLDEQGRQIPIDTVFTYNGYIRPESYELLTTTLPFLTQATRNILGRCVGIHSHGCGYLAGDNTLYQYQTVIDQKAQEMNERYGLTLPDSIEVATEVGHQQAIEIVEDLICDEYALEAAFEGHRFGDLCRLARHKNLSAIFGQNWGGRWLNGKLAFKKTGVDFQNENNWYLPFK